MFQNNKNHFVPVTIRSADRAKDKSLLQNMLQSWAVDINSDASLLKTNVTDFTPLIKGAYEILIAEKNSKPVGLLALTGNPKNSKIEIAYTESDHRGCGVATLLYEYAIKNLNATFIVVTCEAVKNNLHYWKNIGFCSYGVHQRHDGDIDPGLYRLSVVQNSMTPFDTINDNISSVQKVMFHVCDVLHS